jgi:hypothetical protein
MCGGDFKVFELRLYCYVTAGLITEWCVRMDQWKACVCGEYLEMESAELSLFLF